MFARLVLGKEDPPMSSRITLGVSGLDTETLISELMQVERRPLRNLEDRQSILGARKQAWDTVKARIEALIAELTPLISVTGYNYRTASVSDPAVLNVTVADSAPTGKYEIEVASLAKSQVVTSGSFLSSDTPLGLTDDLTLNGKTIALADTDTLATLAAKINGTEGTGVSAVVLQVGVSEYRLSLTAQEEGTANQMVFSDEAGWTELGVRNETGGLNEVRAASDARFSINGVSFVRDGNSISDAISGVTLELNAAVSQETGLGGKTFLTVDHDDQAVVTRVKGFVNEYNSLIETVKRLNSWDPEAKKGGLLFGDSLLQRLMRDVQSVLFRKVQCAPDGFQLAGQVGISTGAVGSHSRDGKLTLDETKLTTALAENRDGVRVLFQGDDSDPGILEGLRTAVRRYSAVDGYLPMRKAQIEEEDKALSRQIANKQRSLDMRLAFLQRQFSALEVLMSKFNTQGTWLSSQLSGLNANT
jgi:flagellar hook-associated protein 2